MRVRNAQYIHFQVEVFTFSLHLSSASLALNSVLASCAIKSTGSIISLGSNTAVVVSSAVSSPVVPVAVSLLPLSPLTADCGFGL
jgi:hypothetical protein